MSASLLSVIAPARDEAPNLARLLEEVRAAADRTGLSWELIVVDDGSTDATWSVLTALAVREPRLRPIRLPGPSGQTAALVAGFRAARGTILATLDADLQCSADAVPELLAQLDGADLICGIRRRRQDSPARRLASATANGVRRALLAPRLADLACPARVFRREALDRLEAAVPLFDGAHRWLPALFRLAGLRVVQRPIAHHRREAGVSKYTTRGRIGPIAREIMIVWRIALSRSQPLRAAAVVVLGALLALPFFVGLGGWPLIEPDEGRNAEVAREMLALGQWVVPHFELLPYLDKPVLLFWAIAGAFRTLGVSEFAARLPSALSAIVTILLTGLLGRRLLGNRGGVIASIVLATAPLVLAFGRLVIFDMMLTALVTAALWCLVEARAGGGARHWWPLAGVAMGLATLTKGPVGIAVPLGAFAVARGALPLRRRARDARAAILAALAVVAIVVPWLVLVQRHEPGFLRYALFDETFLRLVSPSRFNRAAPPWYYLVMLSWVLGIWGLVLVATAGTLVGRRGDGTPETSAAAFAVRATAAIVVFFTLSASKRPGYILPAMVPLAILVAAGIVAAPARATAAIRRGGLLVGALGVLVLAAGLAGVSRKAEGVTVVTPGMLLWAGAFLAIWAVFASAFASRRLWATVVACALFVPGLGAAIYGPLTAYAESRSARAIADHIPSGAPVVCFRAFRTGLPFYLRRPALLLSDDARELTSNYIAANRDRFGAHSEALSAEANLGAVLNQPAPVYVLTSEAGVAQLRAASRRKLTRVYVHGRVRLLRTDG